MVYHAHDLCDRQARRSPFDLFVLGFSGDVKTLAYFLHAVRSWGLPADFCITRLYDRPAREHKWIVCLKRPAWDAIDGETQPATFAALPAVLPAVAEIKRGVQSLIVVEYEEWKARVLKRPIRRKSARVGAFLMAYGHPPPLNGLAIVYHGFG